MNKYPLEQLGVAPGNGDKDAAFTQPLRRRAKGLEATVSKSGKKVKSKVFQQAEIAPPESSPFLISVQKVPDIEDDLQVMMLQRLLEAQVQIYIPPMAKANLQASDKEVFSLKDRVEEFLNSDGQVMLLLGDSGAGKSTFNKHLESNLLKTYKRGGTIPLFINLPALERPAKDLVTEQLKEYNFSDAQIQELKQHRQFIVICDGYDESQLTVNLHTSNNFNRPGQWKVKLIISCRTQYLGPDYRNRFVPQGTNHYNHPSHDIFQEAVIAPFSVEQIQDYVGKYVPLEPRSWSTEDYICKLNEIPNLIDLVKNPFLLSLALEALPDVTEGQQDISAIKITRARIYDTFVARWLNVNKRRLQRNNLPKDDRLALDQLLEAGFVTMGIDYSTRLALAMYEKQNGKAIVQYLHLKDKTTWKTEYFGPDPEIRLLREASPLTRLGIFYQFLHRSMLEYFFSCTVIGPSLQEPADACVPQSVSDFADVQSLDPKCPLFTHNLLTEPSVVQFLSERVHENTVFKDQLLEVIDKSKAGASLATAAANAITILVRAGVTFHRHDFRGVRIPGADLSGGQFDSALFQGADLTNVNLGMSWLRNADVSNARMEGVRFGELPYLEEDNDARSCCYSPDGRMLAVGLQRGDIALHNTETWEEIHVLEGHADVVGCLKFSTTSQRLVSGSQDNTVRVWNCCNGDLLATMDGHMRNVYSVVFSPCGKKVASGSGDMTVRLWDPVTEESMFVLEGHKSSINSVKFTPNGRWIVSCSDDETIRFWDAETGALRDVWEPGHGPVACLDISPDGYQLVSGHYDGTLKLWSTASRSALSDLHGHTNAVLRVLFSADGQRIASTSVDSTVRLWDVSSGVLTFKFSSIYSPDDISFSSNGKHLASIDGSSQVRLWDASSSGSSLGQHEHYYYVTAVAYLPTGQFIWSSSMDKTALQWDARTGAVESIRAFSVDFIHSTAFSPDFNHIAVGSVDGVIQLWDLRTGKQGPALEGHTGSVEKLVFSPCAQWIVSASKDKTVRLWEWKNIEQGHVLAIMDCGGFVHSTMKFSPTGQQLAAGDVDGKVNIYDIQTRTLFRTTILKGETISALAYSPDGQELAIGANGHLSFWDLQSKKPELKLEVDPYGVYCIAYSPCGRWIACGSYHNTVQLCGRHSNGVGAGGVVAVVDGFLGFVADIAWNPVVPLEFVTCGHDRAVRVWRILEGKDGDDVVSVDLVWGSNVGMLGASGMILNDVVGLDTSSRKLLIQRGAVDNNLNF